MPEQGCSCCVVGHQEVCPRAGLTEEEPTVSAFLTPSLLSPHERVCAKGHSVVLLPLFTVQIWVPWKLCCMQRACWGEISYAMLFPMKCYNFSFGEMKIVWGKKEYKKERIICSLMTLKNKSCYVLSSSTLDRFSWHNCRDCIWYIQFCILFFFFMSIFPVAYKHFGSIF